MRSARIIVHDLELIGLDFEFHVERSLKPEQNTAEFLIYGLSEENRKRLQQLAGGVVVKLCAGYEGDPTAVGRNDGSRTLDPPLIFLGKLREITILRAGPEWETRITSGDGDGKDKPVHFSLGPGASLKTAIERTVKEMGVGVGNAMQAIKQGKFKDGFDRFVSGVTVSGRGDEELERLLKSAGLEHSFQGGELQVLPEGAALNTPALLVNQETGLVGSPELGEKGKVKFRSFLTADIYPGRQVHLQARHVDAFFRVETASYIGQWAGNDWYTDVEAKAIK